MLLFNIPLVSQERCSPNVERGIKSLTRSLKRMCLKNAVFKKKYSVLLYLKWITNKDLLYSTGNSAHSDMADWMGQEFGGEWIYTYVWLNSFAVYLKLSQHC